MGGVWQTIWQGDAVSRSVADGTASDDDVTTRATKVQAQPYSSMRPYPDQEQPIVLTAGADCPNAAEVRFLIDGADLPADADSYQRVVLMFDGGDPEALAAARDQWKDAKERGLDVTYWQQDAHGRWERKA